jgi:hypothetical protein
MVRAEISFGADAPDPFVDYAVDLIARATGIGLRAPRDGAEVDVYYGDDVARPCRLRIPRVAGYTAATVPRRPDTGSVAYQASASRDLPFDLFSAVRFWLADEANAAAPPDAFDEHDRLRAERSTQEALGLREVPIVNAYLLFFRAWAEARTGVTSASALPPGKRCIVVLSHDVDSPIDPGSPWHAAGAAWGNVRAARKPLRSVAYAAGVAAHALRWRALDRSGKHGVFEHVMDAEEQRGFRSTFFFAAVSRFDAEGTRLDVGYDVRREPLPESVRAVVSRGFGLGLHVGYEARADAMRIASERARLEDVAGASANGTRHHYWHMTRPFWKSLEAHGAAGFNYDSSVGFNSAPGYRLGIALPFRPWNPETRAPIPVLQVPALMMDSMVMSEPSLEAVGERVAGLLEGLKRFEGVAAIDWHEYTSFPASRRYRRWGEAYLALLDHLAADPEIAVQTFDELVAAARQPGVTPDAGHVPPGRR